MDEMGTGQQSATTPGPPHLNAATLELVKLDVQKIAMALETLVVQVAGLKTQLSSIEKTIRDIALGLGVTPQ